MKRGLALGVVTIVATLAITSLASGKPARTTAVLKFKATLSTSQVVPHPKRTSSAETGTFKWTLTYSHLTGPAIAAHVHLGARGKNGIALVALCGPPKCKSRISKPNANVNVHTDPNEEGEIRGEITAAR